MPCSMYDGVTSGDFAMSASNDLRRDLNESQQTIRRLLGVIDQHAQDLCDLREYVLQLTSPDAREYERFTKALDRLKERQLGHREWDAKRDAGL